MTEESRIRRLDAGTIQRIAAGEVVERPASVVKELLENSLDAGASRISVAVEAGGIDGIRVRDDGHGIPREELPLAVAEHATSKLRDIADLETGTTSLGFRGEALSTIGAVSRLTLRSRAAGASAGAELTVEGGDVSEVSPAGCPVGTTVEVADLFFNTPARRKFLKREATEFDHVSTVVSQYALANPDVAIALEHDGRERFSTEGAGSLRSAVLAVYGREVAESMLEISETATADAPVESISGLISHPETTRSTRAYLATFVNGRYVTTATLRGAVLDGYGGQLAPDRYPFAVLFVEVPPASVDVNVHPRKTEVRFDDEARVERAVRESVERTLIDAGLIRSGAPRGRSAPAETQLSPGGSEREVVGGADTDHEAASGVDADRPRRQRGPTPLDTEDGAVTSTESTPTESTLTGPTSTESASGESTPAESVPTEPTSTESGSTESTPAKTTSTESTPIESTSAESTPIEESAADSTASDDAAGTADPAADDTWVVEGLDGDVSTPTDRSPSADSAADGTQPPWATPEPSAEPTQRTLAGGETGVDREYDQLPALRVLGQLYDTYLLAEAEEGLLLIDQHAADERINYERLQDALADSSTSQRLAEPVSIELTAREAALFEAHADALAELGFRAERRDGSDDAESNDVDVGNDDDIANADVDAANDVDDGSDDGTAREILVTAVPAVFETALDPALLREVLLGFVDGDGADAIEATADDLLADLACYPSVTGNTSLTEGSVLELLAALDDCANPYACPHGRPVIIEISRSKIGERFERDYPGHAGRREE